MCPERTGTAIKRNTDEGRDGQKHLGEAEARCLSGQGEKLTKHYDKDDILSSS